MWPASELTEFHANTTTLLGKTMLGKAAQIDALGPNAPASLQMMSAAIKQAGFSPTGTFKADYKLHAFIPSIGISYSF